MTRKTRWVIGLIVILAAAVIIHYYPLPFLFHPHLPFLGIYKRVLYALLLSAALCLWRVLRGPTASDRIVAVDILGVLIVGLCAILCLATGRNWYIDIGIAWALQSFIGTLALAKYLEGKGFDE